MDEEVVHTKLDSLNESVIRLLNYCKERDWAGFDPYDALNSLVFAKTPFYKSRICRIALTQIMKRLPINLRPLLLVPREQNPKAIALFLKASLKLSKLGLVDYEALVEPMIEKLAVLRSQNTPYWCWGYSFPWQGRSVFVPKWSPNLVCTSFVADALLDAYEINGESHCLSMATSAANYMLNELYWTENDSIAGLSYPDPSVRVHVYNADFLGAALFCRIYKHSGEQKFLDSALKVARYSAAKQHDDGSWDYGELPTQRWIDNFHTGYNLCAIQTIARDTGTNEFDDTLLRGFRYYKDHFFLETNVPKYFHHRAYPLDIHSVAQSIITLLAFKDMDVDAQMRAFSVFEWTMRNMWNGNGHFYYQKYPLFTNKISYMRWSQAWMLLALATLLEYCSKFTSVPLTGRLDNQGMPCEVKE
jgi:hypothetical protein